MTPTNRTKYLLIGGAAGLIVIALALWAYFALTNHDDNAQDSNFSNQVVADVNESANSAAAEFDLSEIQNKETLFARRLAIYDLVDEADEKMLGQLFDQSTQMPSGSFRREIERAIVSKWATVSPQNVLTQLEGIAILRYRDLLSLVFEEWAQYDLDEAVSYATRFGPATRQIVFDSIRETLPDINFGDVMEIAQKLNLDFYATQKYFKELADSEIKNPMEAWTQFIDEH